MKILCKIQNLWENIMTTKSKLVAKQLHNLDLQNAKKLKHSSFSMLPSIYTIAISTNLKYFRKEQTNTLDAKRMCQSHVKGFT
jgi:peroxiredoxin